MCFFFTKKDYFEYEYEYIDDISEIDLIKANWVSLTNPNIYDLFDF